MGGRAPFNEGPSHALRQGISMLKARERWVLYVDVSFGAVPQGAPTDFDIADVIGDLEGVIGSDDAVHFREADRKWTRLMFVEWLPNKATATHACLLFTVGDRDGAPQGLQHMDTGDVRIPPRDDKEGNARSAHLLISLTKSGNGYRALLEDVDSVGKTNLKESVTAMLKKCSVFEYENEDGNRRECRPTFKLDPVEDRDLQNIVSTTKELRYFELIKTNVEEDFDEDAHAVVDQETLRVRIEDDTLAGQGLWAAAKSIWETARGKGFSKFRIVYRRPNEKNTHTVTYDTHREDAEDFLIKRTKRVPLDEKHPEVREDISPELLDKMTAILAHWQAQEEAAEE